MQRLDVEDIDHPSYLVCAITECIFKEPVMIMPSGKLCEWEKLDEVIAIAKRDNKTPTCPLTRINITGYVKSTDLIDAVNHYLEIKPDAVKDQYIKRTNEKVPAAPVILNAIVAKPVIAAPRPQPQRAPAPSRPANIFESKEANARKKWNEEYRKAQRLQQRMKEAEQSVEAGKPFVRRDGF